MLSCSPSCLHDPDNSWSSTQSSTSGVHPRQGPAVCSPFVRPVVSSIRSLRIDLDLGSRFQELSARLLKGQVPDLRGGVFRPTVFLLLDSWSWGTTIYSYGRPYRPRGATTKRFAMLIHRGNPRIPRYFDVLKSEKWSHDKTQWHNFNTVWSHIGSGQGEGFPPSPFPCCLMASNCRHSRKTPLRAILSQQSCVIQFLAPWWICPG